MENNFPLDIIIITKDFSGRHHMTKNQNNKQPRKMKVLELRIKMLVESVGGVGPLVEWRTESIRGDVIWVLNLIDLLNFVPVCAFLF